MKNEIIKIRDFRRKKTLHATFQRYTQSVVEMNRREQLSRSSSVVEMNRVQFPLVSRGLGDFSSDGRIYDPLTAQFLQPDNYIQSPEDNISYNRYAYCRYNPFKYTDPSGEIELEKEEFEGDYPSAGGPPTSVSPNNPMVGCAERPEGWLDLYDNGGTAPGAGTGGQSSQEVVSYVDGTTTILGPGSGFYYRGGESTRSQLGTSGLGVGGFYNTRNANDIQRGDITYKQATELQVILLFEGQTYIMGDVYNYFSTLPPSIMEDGKVKYREYGYQIIDWKDGKPFEGEPMAPGEARTAKQIVDEDGLTFDFPPNPYYFMVIHSHTDAYGTYFGRKQPLSDGFNYPSSEDIDKASPDFFEMVYSQKYNRFFVTSKQSGYYYFDIGILKSFTTGLKK